MADMLSRQLTEIHSMLAAGHRSLRIERHTLVLWGMSGAALLAVSDRILLPEHFPSEEWRALAWLALLTVTLGGVAVVDWNLTRRAKRQRDEALSFLHRQLQKVWWLLMAVGVVLTFATFFFGGGYMVCAAWVVLVGLGLFVHGLFSEDLLEWVGALAILIGIASGAYRLDYDTTRWIAASVLGVGMPLLAVMLGGSRPPAQRMAQAAGWAAAVMAGPLLFHHAATPAEAGPAIPYAKYRAMDPTGRHTVLVPEGTAVPIEVDLGGGLFRSTRGLILPATLAHPVEVTMVDGVAQGPVRLVGQRWLQPQGAVWIRIPRLEASLSQSEGPHVRAQLNVDAQAQ